jgi:hypothetical protein
MNKLRICALATLSALALHASAMTQSFAQTEMFQVLRAGGATLYLRHATAEWTAASEEVGVTDLAKLDARHCAPHRHLSEEGRMQAQAVRNGLQGLSVGALEIYAAGLCRTAETARVLGTPKIIEALTPAASGTSSLRVQGESIDKIVKSGAGGSGLRVIVGDYEVVRALFGATLAEGDAIVLKPGPQGVEALGRIRIGEWTALQPVASAPADRRKF